MKVYLEPEGLELVALGKSLCSWHYRLRDDDQEPPRGGVEVGSFTPVLPTVEKCMGPCLEELRKKEDELRAVFQLDLLELQKRRNDLTMLEFQS